MLIYLWVSLGGAIGTAARFWISGLLAQRYGETFPFGTMVVNVTGSLLIGMFFELTSPDGRLVVSPTWRAFVTIGICGGYTTFSSFSLQTFALLQDGEWLRAAVNVIGSFLFCLGAVWLGYFFAYVINRP